MNKQEWLDLAEVLDAHRVFPKVIMVLCYVAYGVFSYDSYVWIKDIYEATKGVPTSVATFAGATLSALGGVLTMLTNKYFEGGRRWTNNSQE